MTTTAIRHTTDQLIVVISGPSGAGKDSVVKALLKRDRKLCFVVTTTTRPMRQDEIQGRDYYFVSQSNFERMLSAGEFVEHAIVYGDYKGITRKDIQEAIGSGCDVVLRLDVQGAATIKNLYKESVLLFLTPGSKDQLLIRLQSRKSETSNSIQERITTAFEEDSRRDEFDYIIVNKRNDLGGTVDKIQAIIKRERKGDQ
jgi:guanylate kinase|tara:strand:- start:163 stop:762 length:600 start_codon:yes stop_codon:yes gene_type:complete